MEKKQTEEGEFVQDDSGLWHYNATSHRNGHVLFWIEDALKHKPEGPAWFWFQGEPAPIVVGDTPETLNDRWAKFNNPYHEQNRKPFLQSMLEFVNQER